MNCLMKSNVENDAALSRPGWSSLMPFCMSSCGFDMFSVMTSPAPVPAAFVETVTAKLRRIWSVNLFQFQMSAKRPEYFMTLTAQSRRETAIPMIIGRQKSMMQRISVKAIIASRRYVKALFAMSVHFLIISLKTWPIL